jgi:hypothetical protein
MKKGGPQAALSLGPMGDPTPSTARSVAGMDKLNFAIIASIYFRNINLYLDNRYDGCEDRTNTSACW